MPHIDLKETRIISNKRIEIKENVVYQTHWLWLTQGNIKGDNK